MMKGMLPLVITMKTLHTRTNELTNRCDVMNGEYNEEFQLRDNNDIRISYEKVTEV